MLSLLEKLKREDVVRRLDSLRWNIENDLRGDSFRDDPWVKTEFEKNVDALQYAINVLNEQQ